MTQYRGQLLVNKTWNAQRRYKIGQSVSYLNVVYTNATGNNSIPGTNDDWVSLSSSSANAYPGTFIYTSGPQTFTVPSNTKLNSVFLNRGLLDDLTDWSLSGTILTILTPLAPNDEIKAIGIN